MQDEKKKIKWIPQEVKDLFFKVIKSDSSTKSIADGFGIGLFIGFMPIMGIQMYVAFVVTRFFNKNQFVAMLAVWVTNPLTAPFIYYFNYYLGTLIYPTDIQFDFNNMTWKSFFDAGADLIVPLLIGSFVVSVFFGVLGQQLCLRYYDRIKAKFNKEKNLAK